MWNKIKKEGLYGEDWNVGKEMEERGILFDLVRITVNEAMNNW